MNSSLSFIQLLVKNKNFLKYANSMLTSVCLSWICHVSRGPLIVELSHLLQQWCILGKITWQPLNNRFQSNIISHYSRCYFSGYTCLGRRLVILKKYEGHLPAYAFRKNVLSGRV